VLDEPPDDVEAQARSLPGRLRREERLEDPVADVGGNAGAVVGDPDDDFSVLAAGDDLDTARFRDGVERVVDQVSPDLVQLAGEAADARQVRLHAHGHGDGLAARLGFQDGDRVAEALAEIQRARGGSLVHVRESLDRQDQPGDSRRGVLDLGSQAAHRAPGGRPAQRGLERGALDGGGDLVERLDPDRGLGQRLRRGRIQAACRQPVGYGFLALGVLEGRPHAVLGAGGAGIAHVVDRVELGVGQVGRAERARHLLDVLEAAPEQRGAALDRGRGVVELVGEARRQASEGNHLLVVQLVGREVPRPIDHPVDEDRRQLGARPRDGANLLAGHDEDLRRLQDERPAGRSAQARVRKQARDVAALPFRELVRPRTPVHEDRDAA